MLTLDDFILIDIDDRHGDLAVHLVLAAPISDGYYGPYGLEAARWLWRESQRDPRRLADVDLDAIWARYGADAVKQPPSIDAWPEPYWWAAWKQGGHAALGGCGPREVGMLLRAFSDDDEDEDVEGDVEASPGSP